MTTIMTPPEPASYADRAPRLLSIAANLLPVEIIDARRGRKVRRVVISSLGAFLALLVAWYGVAALQTSVARQDLAEAKADVKTLTKQQGDFTELLKAQTESSAIQRQLTALMGTDLQWSQLIVAIEGAAIPTGVQLASVSSQVNPNIQGAPTSGGSGNVTRLPNTTEKKIIGSMVINGSAESKEGVASFIEALAQASGLANPFLTSSSQESARVRFAIQVDIVDTALGGRFSKENKPTAGGK